MTTVVTCLLTAYPDPQRGYTWPCDPATVEKLAESVRRHGFRFVVLHDEEPVSEPTFGEWVWVDRKHPNVYFARWQHIADWLSTSIDEFVWAVDGSDVVMLHEPRPERGLLYVGSETLPVGNPWLYELHPSVRPWIERNKDETMLNAGIVGGETSVVRKFVRELAATANEVDVGDMGVFNEVARSERWKRKLRFGESVHTRFKGFELDHPTAWWAHK